MTSRIPSLQHSPQQVRRSQTPEPPVSGNADMSEDSDEDWNKENVPVASADISTNQDEIEPESSKLKPIRVPPTLKNRPALWKELREAGTKLIAITSNFQNLQELPFSGTMLEVQTMRDGLLYEESCYHAWVAVQKALEKDLTGEDDDVFSIKRVFRYYKYELSAAFADALPGGRHFTFVDMPVSGDEEKIILYARLLVGKLRDKDISRERVVISIPATQAGIRATLRLTKYKIRVNLTHVTGFTHAMICIEAGAHVITFCGEEMLRAHVKGYMTLLDHPGIRDIQTTINYVRMHKIPVQLMATHMPGQILLMLKGLDYLGLTDSALNSVQEQDVAFDPQSESEHSTLAAQAPYPSTFLELDENNVFCGMTEAECKLADATLHEAKRLAGEAMAEIMTWIITETFKQREIQTSTSADLMNKHLQQLCRLGSGELQEDEAKALAETFLSESNYIGARMISMTWGTPLEDEDEDTDAASDEAVLDDTDTWTSDPEEPF